MFYILLLRLSLFLLHHPRQLILFTYWTFLFYSHFYIFTRLKLKRYFMYVNVCTNFSSLCEEIIQKCLVSVNNKEQPCSQNISLFKSNHLTLRLCPMCIYNITYKILLHGKVVKSSKTVILIHILIFLSYFC